MGNFDLKKYLAEGKLLKEEVDFDLEAWSKGKDYDGPMLDADLMFFIGNDEYRDRLLTNQDEDYTEEDVKFIKDRFVDQDKISAKEFEKRFSEYWSEYGDYGGDTDSIVAGFEAHIKKGMLTPEEAGIAFLIYSGEVDYESAKEYLEYFINNPPEKIDEGKLHEEEMDLSYTELTDDEKDDVSDMMNNIYSKINPEGNMKKNTGLFRYIDAWFESKGDSLAEGKLVKEDSEDIAEMAYERDSVIDIVKRIKPILSSHPQLEKTEDPEQYLIDFVTKRKKFLNRNEAPIGKDKFIYGIGTVPYEKYIKFRFNEYMYNI